MLIHLIRTYARPYRRAIAAVLALQLVTTLAALYLPTLNAEIIDRGVAAGDTGFIVRTGAWMLLFSVLQIGATVWAVSFSARTAMGVGRDLRAAVFHRVGTFSAREVALFGAPTLISRTTNDVTQVQTLLFMALAMMVSAPISMIGGIIMALRQDAGLSWLIVVAVPLLILGVGAVIRQMLPQFRTVQGAIDSVNRVLREQITGIRVVRAFVREDVETARFAVANATLTDAALTVGRLQAWIFPIVSTVLNVSTVAVLWFGAGRVQAGEMQVGALTAFMAYLMQILMAVMMATFMSMMIPRASVSAERIGAVLDTESSVVPPTNPVTAPPHAAEVEVRDVSFQYPGAQHPVLEHVSFTARPGQTTAIIGSTGAGKTTLLNLISRSFDATGGSVRLGGVDVRNLALDSVWAHVGVVPQRPFLFSGTVASNLRYGKPGATDEELWDALRIAQAADFVAAMDGGLDAKITQGGSNVSGGQRQRLAIARAVVRRPDVYVFDDAFSALDLATDARLRRALHPVTQAATVIVVAQRVSTIVDFDQIIVLDDGRIVGQGTHDELLLTCPTYQEIARSQQAAQDEVAA
ncbi:ATP-binding cassette subfamily B protein [Deinococcus metalli]|uniref:ATP-binding cassette subfamily B protein n=1 Tax=Deinococcus metalli TaxID=1141878 RepID=A0A7W8KAR4_9DEIO|nr:ABC transporter ATP-binding protein [Deinococcus metalli]MBB5374799.1 ATP-binding cassette subfamily B protein [Deinococcus metalli]GHF33622.1 multidrug ABC transporter ATP-binding protein [Deinococcus metalli]